MCHCQAKLKRKLKINLQQSLGNYIFYICASLFFLSAVFVSDQSLALSFHGNNETTKKPHIQSIICSHSSGNWNLDQSVVKNVLLHWPEIRSGCGWLFWKNVPDKNKKQNSIALSVTSFWYLPQCRSEFQ